MSYKVLASRVIYSGRVFTVRSDRVALPNGLDSTLDIVEHSGAVVIIPQDTDGGLVMIRQYRHAAQTRLLEFPAGTLEAGEDPESCAQRELREETGLAAASLVKLGGFFLAPGYSTEYLHVYLATGLSPDPLPQDADEMLEVEKIPLADLLERAARGKMEDAKSLAALHLALPHLGGPSHARV
jgi:ADP-ribose pyrophosphatase